MFSTKGIIKQKVLSVIEAKIEAGESQYQEDCARIDQEAFQKKVDAAERIVDGIIQ